MIIPYSVDVPYDRRPFVNWLIVAGIIFVFALQIMATMNYLTQTYEDGYEQQQTEEEPIGPVSQDEQVFEEPTDADPIRPFILDGWGIRGLFGHMWLHAGILHLVGNLLFLWIFGNAVCAKIGNKYYLLMYLGFGLIAAMTHLIFNGGPMIGASGAINGLVAMFLIFFPENDINCLWVLFFPYMRKFSISSYWMILLWFVYDIWGLVIRGDKIAYFAHLGGFGAGLALAVFLLERKLVTMEDYEKSLLQLIGLGKTKSKEYSNPNLGQWQHLAEPIPTEPEKAKTISLEPKIEEPQKISLNPSPISDEFIRFNCICGKKVKVPNSYAGKRGKCPRCKKVLKIPAM